MSAPRPRRRKRPCLFRGRKNVLRLEKTEEEEGIPDSSSPPCSDSSSSRSSISSLFSSSSGANTPAPEPCQENSNAGEAETGDPNAGEAETDVPNAGAVNIQDNDPEEVIGDPNAGEAATVEDNLDHEDLDELQNANDENVGENVLDSNTEANRSPFGPDSTQNSFSVDDDADESVELNLQNRDELGFEEESESEEEVEDIVIIYMYFIE